MDFSVKLASLPEGLDFPERFRERLRFDPAQCLLSYRGFMTKCSYDELSALSNDPEYHRALEQLFVLTSGEVTAGEKHPLTPMLMMASVAAAVVAAALVWGAVRHVSAQRQPSQLQPGQASTVTVANGS